MTTGQGRALIESCLQRLQNTSLTPLDLLPYQGPAEKLIGLVLFGPPAGVEQEAAVYLAELARSINSVEVGHLKVVVLGGGSGLSNVIGGDSRNPGWPAAPFQGLKEIFPRTRAIVCTTDDGDSTGELMKDLPLVALGDIRHVLLSSVQKTKLQELYGLSENSAGRTVELLHRLFNYRFCEAPASGSALLSAAAVDLKQLPAAMGEGLGRLVAAIFADSFLVALLKRPHCVGNLLLAAAIYLQIEGRDGLVGRHGEITGIPGHAAVLDGLRQLAVVLGAEPLAVLPCTTTPARLQVLYSNRTLVTGEHKSGQASRGYPVDRVFVEFVKEPFVLPEVMESIREAELIILAPGSLYTSIIPILQVPGLAGAVRGNSRALKILVANLWVQKGETDLVRDDPKRRFYVSDLITAYHRNIPGGVADLFQYVLSLGLRDISGSILQSYAMERKVPIFLDRNRVEQMGFSPVEAEVYSKTALLERGVIQHAPEKLAQAIKTLWAVHGFSPAAGSRAGESADCLPVACAMEQPLIRDDNEFPCQRFAAIREFVNEKAIIRDQGAEEGFASRLRERLLEIIWRHQDILVSHLDDIKGFVLVDQEAWSRNQKWDNVFSFYDPFDGRIRIRRDILEQPLRFEVALLIAMGQAVLGKYVSEKRMLPVDRDNETLGRVFRIVLYPAAERRSFLSSEELDRYLRLIRMVRSARNDLVYTRLINGSEGFTPPGLLFGLCYAWYLDNRFASHIEYKMSVMKNEPSNLVPEQVRIFFCRQALVDFFREVVFRHNTPVHLESLSTAD